MNLEELPEQFEAFVDRASAALSREVASAKKALAALNAEKSAVQSALSNLQSQIQGAQDQLTAVTRELQRSTVLHSLGGDIAGARKTLEGLKAETAKEAKALAKLTKERTERQAQVTALGNEVTDLVAVRANNQELMAKLKQQIGALL
jgi:chromosome segregation ATPase